MVSKDHLVSMNVTYSFVAKNPVKMTFSFASNRDIAGYVLAWGVELSQAGYAVSQTDSFAIAGAKRSYSGTNSTCFYEDPGLSRFSVGISWEDAWEQYQGTNLDGNSMVVTFGPFDLKAGEAVVVDPTITTNVGSSGDTHVSEGSPTTNYGTSTSMQVQLFKDEYGTVYRNRIFIKFDLSSLPINIDITSAKLYLYMYSSTAHTRTLAVHEVSDNSWGETTITWNNKPSYDATATTTTSIGTSSGWKYFTITSDVEDAYNAASQTLSECIKDNSETTGVPTVPSSITKQFYTEEYVPSSYRPYLQVTYEAKYAVIIAGAWNATSNYVHFWNDATFLYDILVNSYGYTDSTIFFLYADGNTPSISNCNLLGDPRPFSGTIDYSNINSNIRTVFSNLASTMTSNNPLLILCSTHGDNASGTHSFFTWGDLTTYVTDDDFAGANYLGAITSYSRETIIMQQCYSGGFIEELSSDTRVVTTACDGEHPAWGRDSPPYGAFDYELLSAINWGYPGGSSVDADTNDDGIVSMHEAFDYAYDNDPFCPWFETPQWDDPGSIGDNTYP